MSDDTTRPAAEPDSAAEDSDVDPRDLVDAEAGESVDPEPGDGEPAPAARPAFQPSRRVAFVVIPVLTVMAAAGAGVLGWQYASARDVQKAVTESVDTARETTAAILSYTPETVDAQLNGARDRLTGGFLESYTKLVNEAVIPGAKEKKITAVAKVAAAASVSATGTHAVALVFVNQTVTMGTDAGKAAPTVTNSSVRVTLEKVDNRWLVSGFDPV